MSKFKNETTINEEFKNMLSSAEAYFNTTNPGRYEYHQCLVLRTNRGEEKILSFACNSVNELIEQGCSALLQLGNTTVQKIICMWQGGAIDVPSNRFMKTLCNLNPENKHAEVLLNAGDNGYAIKKISDIIG